MYAKLVLKNAKRSVKDYLIYIVTMTICVALFYSFLSISSRYYRPDIGSEYKFRILGDGMKWAISAVTLLLLFLVRYVNQYMLRRRQKEFAVQSIMGMEQKIIGRIFFAETFIMGLAAIVIGIFFGVFGSQFITAMLLTSYGKSYQITWTLFPDTVLYTIGFFVLSYLAVGLFNLRTIRKIKIIDMLSADKENEPSLKKSRQMPIVVILFEVMVFWMLFTGIQKMYFYFDSRFAAPVHIMFWGNILFPAVTLLWPVVWRLKYGRRMRTEKQRSGGRMTGGHASMDVGAGRSHKDGFPTLVSGLLICAVCCAFMTASVPVMQSQYYLVLGVGESVLDQYMMFILADLLFFICAVIYLANRFLTAWKEKSPEHRYRGQNLFFWGQITTKLSTTNKTMTLICITLVMAVFLFMAAPILVGWARGFLEVRSKYDVQIFTGYRTVYEEKDLPHDDYAFVTDFLEEHDLQMEADCIFNLYLPRREDFHNRVKRDFPVVAIALSDYNRIRQMLGYEMIALGEDEFTTQWQTIASEEEREQFLQTHAVVTTDAGHLRLSDQACYSDALGETLYNSYTDVLLVFPDSVCQKLLSVMRNRYIMTTEPISYTTAEELEALFLSVYPEETEEGAYYGIGMRTLQVNSTKAGMFVLQAVMIYGGIVLMVICLTILSLQQLLDAGHYRYRFLVLRHLGVEERDIRNLILKQLGVWFGLPVMVALLSAAVVVTYFIQSVSAEITAYIGFGTLFKQILMTGGILALLLIGYFISTWELFKHSVGPAGVSV
ncbi:MAG: ABC transporter permease [Lachnospiraceae bacterium]|nr:ABC transporter permease [Lachnospiraceae bacterium]